MRSDGLNQLRKHGVAVYIKNCIKLTVVSCDVANVLTIPMFEFDIYILNVYIPPSYNSVENL